MSFWSSHHELTWQRQNHRWKKDIQQEGSFAFIDSKRTSHLRPRQDCLLRCIQYWKAKISKKNLSCLRAYPSHRGSASLAKFVDLICLHCQDKIASTTPKISAIADSQAKDSAWANGQAHDANHRSSSALWVDKTLVQSLASFAWKRQNHSWSRPGLILFLHLQPR